LPANRDSQVFVGADPDIGPNPEWNFHGCLDELKLYDRALTGEEVAELYRLDQGTK
jgi:hypothetical protein